MLVSPSGLIAYARTEEARKKLRYVGVSLVFFPLGQGLIQALGLWLNDYTKASLVAWAIATVPGFFAYKRFVWRDMPREKLHRQLLVFWAAVMLTVSVTTLFSYLVQNATADQTMLVRGAAVFCAQVVGFVIVWVGRFLMLDRWLWARSPTPDEH
jgi:putative flippase GtrA